VSGPDPALRRAHGDTPDLLNRAAGQSAAALAPVPFFGGAGSFARQRRAAIIAKAGITRETRSRQGWHRHVSLVTLAFARRAVVKRHPTTCHPKNPGGRAAPLLVRWSVPEIRRAATRLALRQSEPVFVIAWSAWRRAHQAAAQKAHITHTAQL
jgi:hypothetical protein